MPDINPLTNNQIFLKKIAENTGSDYETGDVSEINPLTIDQIFLKEIAANTAGQSGDITELEEKVSATQDMLSDAYDSTHTYNVGNYCIYENVLYKCNTASTIGDWDSSKWDAVTVAEEMELLTERVDSFPMLKMGDSYTFDSGKDCWFGYFISKTRAAIFIPILIDNNISDGDLHVTLPVSSNLASTAGLTNLINLSINAVYRTIYGLTIDFNFDQVNSIVEFTPCTGMFSCTISIY